MKKEHEHPLAGTISEYLAALKGSAKFGPQVVHHEIMTSQPPRFGRVTREWSPAISALLDGMGLDSLFCHQSEAIDLIRQGRDVIVATPTASGKSLIYNLPVLEAVLAEPQCRALYLFPLKALAQDQLRTLREMIGAVSGRPPGAAICDGDTSAHMRRKLRDNPPNILISNPDMLHLSLLGYHESWAGFWQGLSYVILDEVHTYRGVMGSHMAWVLRRLRRICRLYGREPQFILSSATVGNPEQLARDLLGRPVQVVSESGAARPGRHFVFFDPLDSAGYAASQLLEAALKRGLRTIVYTQSRKMTELIYLWTQARLGPLQDKLTSYRAGFLPEDRRLIEAQLAGGDLLGVVSTSALELGIDIGELELCILVGYPGTIMATWQRGGRVGRRELDSLIILVAQEDALDHHFMQHPEDFFRRPVEPAVLNPDNRVIVQQHLICAAAERAIACDDPILESEVVRDVLATDESGQLLLAADGSRWHTNRKYPHRGVNLRGGGQSFAIRVAGEEGLLGAIDGHRCLTECHKGAIYLHQGRTWLVTELNLEGHEVTVTRKEADYFTRCLSRKETEILNRYQTVTLTPKGLNYPVRVSFGYLRVTAQVTGFQRRLVRGQKLIGSETLELPANIFETEGLWLEIPPALQTRLEHERVHFMGGIHAAEHAAISIFPLLVLCDRNDIGGISIPFHPQLQSAAIFIYDGYPGGVGLSRLAFSRIGELLDLTREAIVSCPCELGCPSCVHSPKCGSGNRPIDKEAARKLLEGLTGSGKLTESVPPLAKGGNRVPVVAKKEAGPKRNVLRPPLRYGVFDLETQRSAEEVGGWGRAREMGISVGVIYDAGLEQFLTFRENEIEALIDHLRSLELVVGFNSIRFDYQVLGGYSAFDFRKLPSLDLLQEVKNRLGYRLSLDHLATHTLERQKSGDGLLALQWYKEGRIDEIIHYCQKDVEITRDLFLYGLEHGYLMFRNKAGNLVRCPCRFEEKFPGRK